ncbi:MAG: aspartate kinase [Candidatus Lokiarchaeota archaeon]
MTIIVMKFGGSCLKDEEAFKRIHKISKLYSKEKKVYVASAFNGITDLLLSTAQNLDDPIEVDKKIALIERKHLDVIEKIFKRHTEHYDNTKLWLDARLSELEDLFTDIKEFGLEPYYKDYALSFGERISTYILKEYLLSKKFDAEYISGKDIIITNDQFGNAYPLYELTNNRIKSLLLPLLENPNKNTIICVTGFLGRNKIGYITTLGRGGSDYTSTIIARALHRVGKDKDITVILWKDVDGLLAVNPKYIPNPALIRKIDYEEAKQIANFGTKILHPKCLEAIEEAKIPLEIRNFNSILTNENFTKISSQSDTTQIKGISTVEKAMIITLVSGSMVDVPGILARIFKIMGENGISVSFVAQSSSEISTSFIVKEEDSDKSINILRSEEFFSDFYEIKWEEVAIINITGSKVLENSTKIKIFTALDINY